VAGLGNCGVSPGKGFAFRGWNQAGKWLESGLPLFKILEGFRHESAARAVG
jgi:hypothetical protein